MSAQNGITREQAQAFAGSKRGGESMARSSIGNFGGSMVVSGIDNLIEDTLSAKNNNTPLTKRELEILRLIISGKTNKEIAQTLHRAQRTVEYHRNRLMRKLDVHNMADLVKRAISMGVC